MVNKYIEKQNDRNAKLQLRKIFDPQGYQNYLKQHGMLERNKILRNIEMDQASKKMLSSFGLTGLLGLKYGSNIQLVRTGDKTAQITIDNTPYNVNLITEVKDEDKKNMLMFNINDVIYYLPIDELSNIAFKNMEEQRKLSKQYRRRYEQNKNNFNLEMIRMELEQKKNKNFIERLEEELKQIQEQGSATEQQRIQNEKKIEQLNLFIDEKQKQHKLLERAIGQIEQREMMEKQQLDEKIQEHQKKYNIIAHENKMLFDVKNQLSDQNDEVKKINEMLKEQNDQILNDQFDLMKNIKKQKSDQILLNNLYKFNQPESKDQQKYGFQQLYIQQPISQIEIGLFPDQQNEIMKNEYWPDTNKKSQFIQSNTLHKLAKKDKYKFDELIPKKFKDIYYYEYLKNEEDQQKTWENFQQYFDQIQQDKNFPKHLQPTQKLHQPTILKLKNDEQDYLKKGEELLQQKLKEKQKQIKEMSEKPFQQHEFNIPKESQISEYKSSQQQKFQKKLNETKQPLQYQQQDEDDEQINSIFSQDSDLEKFSKKSIVQSQQPPQQNDNFAEFRFYPSQVKEKQQQQFHSLENPDEKQTNKRIFKKIDWQKYETPEEKQKPQQGLQISPYYKNVNPMFQQQLIQQQQNQQKIITKDEQAILDGKQISEDKYKEIAKKHGYSFQPSEYQLQLSIKNFYGMGKKIKQKKMKGKGKLNKSQEEISEEQSEKEQSEKEQSQSDNEGKFKTQKIKDVKPVEVTIKNPYEQYKNIKKQIIDFRIEQFPKILQIGPTGAGKTQVTNYLIENFAQSNGKQKTKVYIFIKSIDQNYDKLKKIYDENDYDFEIINSEQQLKELIDQFHDEYEQGKKDEIDIDKDLVNKKQKTFIVKRLMVFDDMMDFFKRPKNRELFYDLILHSRHYRLFLIVNSQTFKQQSSMELRQNINYLYLHQGITNEIIDQIKKWFIPKQYQQVFLNVYNEMNQQKEHNFLNVNVLKFDMRYSFDTQIVFNQKQ